MGYFQSYLYDSQSWMSCTCFLLLFLFFSSSNGQNFITTLLVVTQGILVQNVFPTLINIVSVIASRVYETIKYNKMVLSRILQHLVNLTESSGSEWIVILWAEVMLNGANVFREVHKYPACTKHCRIIGQRIGHNGERVNFFSGSASSNTFGASIGFDEKN